jgi:hypothetical protein
MRDSSSEARSTASLGRWFVAVLAAALVAHGVLLWQLVDRYLRVRHPVEPLAAELAYATLPTLVCAGFLLWRFPLHTRAVAATMIFVIAAALLSPGVVLTVGLMFLSAYVVGVRALALVRDTARETPALPPAVPVLVGISLWIGLIAATLVARVHVAPVYAVSLLLPLVLFARATGSALLDCARWLARPGDAPPWTERAWLAALVALATVHLLLVARPEVGFDSQTMHLHFAQLLREHRQWSFDVTRYVWAVMPLGADLGFAAAYLLGGEVAARGLNFAFGVLAAFLVYHLTALYARRELALASVALLASTPLVFLETATLFVENLWTAFLLGALLLALAFARRPHRRTLCAFAFAAAGAMQCKAIAAIWIVPLCCAVLYLAGTARRELAVDRRAALLLALAATVGAWPYANAWVRTGNPVFPFANAVFGSPLFDTAESFNNPTYNAPLTPWTLHEIVLSSGRYIEGTDGALGAHWLLLIPVALLGAAWGRPRAQWLSLSLAVFFFVAVYLQQSYLRYLFPALVLLAVFAAWVLQDLPDSRGLRLGLLALGVTLCAVNLRMMPAASHANARLCPNCAYDALARQRFVETYAPHRVVSDYLNRALPQARVGFLLLNAESPAGYVGYSRSANWHDWTLFKEFTSVPDAEGMRGLARAHRLTHVVYSASEPGPTQDSVRAFAARYATPVWRFGDYVVAEIRPD